MPQPVHSREPSASAAGAPFWLSPASYWMPVHYPTTAWTTHAPFAAWLMDALRPRVVVELGTHFGYSAFAFAEAAKRLGLPTTINALDSWEGDDHAGFYDDEVYRYVDETARTDYPDSLRLVRGYFSDSRGSFEPASVDLLHIDGRHEYEDVLADWTEWSSAVREGGVVLFHDIAERDNGFGVWRLWEQIATPGRSFAFEHGHGLGVLSVGEPSTPALRDLFSADAETAALIRADFERLGEACERQAWLLTLPVELDQVRAVVREQSEITDRQHELTEHLTATLKARTAQVEALEASMSWRVTRPLRAVRRLRSRPR